MAVVGDGHGVLPNAVDVGYQLFDIAGAIEEGSSRYAGAGG